MTSTCLPISSYDLDLNQSLLCGQVFRWKKIGKSFIGIDGSNFAKISLGEERVIGIEDTNAALSNWERFFHLELKTEEVWNQFNSADPSFSRDFSHLSALRLLRPSNPIEVLFCFLCTSNNHLSRIQKMVDTLANLGQTAAEIDGHKVKNFPSLDRLSKVSEAEFRNCGFGYRGATIPNVVAQLQDRGDDWLTSLKEADYKEAHFELIKLSGVGPKLADCICLYGLHFDSAVPVDTHLHQAVARRYLPTSPKKAMTKNFYNEIGDLIRERFGELAGWAQLILYYDNLLKHRRGSIQ